MRSREKARRYTRAGEEFLNFHLEKERLSPDQVPLQALQDTFSCIVYNLFNRGAGGTWIFAGFYNRVEGQDALYRGGFQGEEPGCYPIPFGKGFCGGSMAKRRTIIVHDVNDEEWKAAQGLTHIACDDAAQSEIVFYNRHGVFDADSSVKRAFDEVDAECLEQLFREFPYLFSTVVLPRRATRARISRTLSCPIPLVSG